MQGLYDNKKGNYFNIIDFLIEMEPVFFQKTILLSYIKDFLSHCNSTYKKSEKVKIESIRLRQAYTFHNIFYIGLGIKFNPKDIHDSFKRLLPSDSFIRLKSIRIKDINELVAGNFEDELAKLFVIKRIPIFQEIAFKENIDLGKLKRSWKKNEIITLNDQPTHFLNDYRKFDSITSTLFLQDANYSEREFKRFVLSYDKCLKLKKDLEQSALEVESEDALFTI